MRLAFFEKKADFVAGFKKVTVADVIALLASTEFGHGMVV